MKTALGISILLFVATTTFGQIPSQSQLIPTQFAFPTSVGYNGNAFQYDMVANELGIHLVQEDGNSIKYSLLGVSGNVLRTATITSNGTRPAITSHKRSGMIELNVVYRDGDSLRLKHSTDGGISWLSPSALGQDASSIEATDRIDAEAQGDTVYVTWDTQNREVHFARFNYNFQPPRWEAYQNVSENVGPDSGDVGWYPAICISKSGDTTRIHISYITEVLYYAPYQGCTGEEPPPPIHDTTYSFQRVVSRNYNPVMGWQGIVTIRKTVETPDSSQNAHYKQDCIYPAINSDNQNFYVATADYNLFKIHQVPSCSTYHYTEIFYRKSWWSDSGLTGITENIMHYTTPGYSRGHHISKDPYSGSLSLCKTKGTSGFWIILRPDSLTDSIEIVLSHFGNHPKNSSNRSSNNLVLWLYQSSINGFRIPRYILNDIDDHTYFISKNRIGKSYDVSLNSGVNAVVFDTLALDSSSIFRVKGKLDVNSSGIVAVLSNSQLIVDANATLEIKPGGKIIVYKGGNLIVNSNGRINLQDGSIRFEDSSFAIISDPLGIRGHGTIINSQISWKSTFQVDDTTHLVFDGGGTLTLKDSSSYHNINISGNLMFAGSTKSYDLIMDTASIIYANLGGKFETWEGATIRGIPNIQGIYPSYIKSICTAQNPCDWQFKQKAPCDIYGTIEGRYTHYHGITENDTLREWQGIMVGYEDARIDLDNCTIEDIYVNNPSGSAIHLYEARNTQNKVSNSIIRVRQMLRAAEEIQNLAMGSSCSPAIKYPRSLLTTMRLQIIGGAG